MTDIFDRRAGANSLLSKKGGYDNLEVYRYPSEIGKTDPDGSCEYPHYMMFYVFTRESEIRGNIAKKIMLTKG